MSRRYPHLERTDESLDPSDVVVQPIEHALEKRASQPQGHVARCHCPPEDALQDCFRLYAIELRPVYEPAGRLEQPRLQQLNRRGNTEQQRKWYLRPPRT